MREFVIIGVPNSGKTLFILNFAAYLGGKNLDLAARAPDGTVTDSRLTLDQARRELCGGMRHKTRQTQSLTLRIPLGKTAAQFRLSDTCGLTAQIHAEESIRKGMAQTLELMRRADFIFHMIDLSAAEDGAAIDADIYRYGMARRSYLILANKFDLYAAKPRLPKCRGLFAGANVVAVSALNGYGFKEVKAHVARNV